MTIDPPEIVDENHGQAAALFNQMHQLRKAWTSFMPSGVLKRSDMMLLGAIEYMNTNNTAPITASSLAKHMRQSVPGISQRVTALQEMGYLKRTVDKTDRRVAYLAPTPQGQAAAKQEITYLLENIEKALDTLGPEKSGQLLQLLPQFIEALQHVQHSTSTAEGEKKA